MDLKKKLDRIFSKYIRLRDSDDEGICRCITCNRIHHWKDMDAGHFISRGELSTRYDEKNVHAQCRSCNRFKSGYQFEHGLKIDEKYGKDTAMKLYIKSKQPSFFKRYDYQEKIKYYEEKIKRLTNVHR